MCVRLCIRSLREKEKDAARSVIVFDSPTVDVENEHSTLIKAEPPDSFRFHGISFSELAGSLRWKFFDSGEFKAAGT